MPGFSSRSVTCSSKAFGSMGPAIKVVLSMTKTRYERAEWMAFRHIPSAQVA